MFKYLVILCAACVILSACSSAKRSQNSNTHVVVENEEPKYINSQWLKDSISFDQYTIGDTINITKKALFTSGHIWILKGIDGEGVKFLKEEHSRDLIEDKKVDLQHFKFISFGAGDNIIYFEYKKPYSNNVGLIDTVYVTIIE